ncbi:uncharacterized protein NECHADRAFT_48632 [Fusarium vanettenii 77-13-4]|uniref:Uncharacterized protein n=1 Tax=Fusarium vanettenii (strain ATCC MYA-4622 / CBS 123669 / FGSC 9596 / NRRL 45880 / 77-13-4) TaxID=660122 RepID=C7YTC6_FUSV7|nr:uncharacterized protein NECHADRAFT_48632 [Fusarium vanettenii 77-13-4]EEU44223.1 hypothetical protein NECHADRAFT_48632 [Fusarium vanettenii 77-13-4]
MAQLTTISIGELSRHFQDDNGWMALNGVIWDFSNFADKHPSGRDIIQQHLGKDGSQAYNEIHSSGMVLRYLGEERKVGVMMEQVEHDVSKKSTDKTANMPGLSSLTHLSQFEQVAKHTLSEKAWVYIFSATEDGISHAANTAYHQRVIFRPKVLRGVGQVDISTSFLGQQLSCPILVAPTSSIKLTHPDSEGAMARASQVSGVPPIIPSMGSYSVAEVIESLEPSYPFFMQLYIHRNRAETRRLLDDACRLGAKAIIVTVDLPVLSKRETSTSASLGGERARDKSTVAPQQAPTPANTIIDADLNWQDIKWIRDTTNLPVLIKGVQSAEDAKQGLAIGCAGIYLSNHGGRALDAAPPATLVLLEIQKTCPEILKQMEVVVDGGFRRGSEVLKAICLGATVVCLGRPFLYALAYGEEGAILLKEELKTAMQLLGVVNLKQADLGYLNTSRLERLLPLPVTDGAGLSRL